jgi:hypothetical protein
MPDHKTFCAFGAYAVNVIKPHATVVMPLANASDLGKEIDESKLVSVDLQQRLGVAQWDEVTLDTVGLHGNGEDKLPAPAYPPDDGINVLTVGPVFPGQHVGGIYMERSKFFKEIRPVFDPPDPRNPDERRWPHAGLHTYQIMSSASRVGNTISRYHGFHAKVIWSEGSRKVLEVNGTTIFIDDMNDRTLCDDPVLLTPDVQDPDHHAAAETVLDAKSAAGDQGAIFLSLALSANIGLVSPKEPPGADGLNGGADHASTGSAARVVAVPNRRRREVAKNVPVNGFNGTFFNIGAPDSDLFTQSVFDRSFTRTRPQARKQILESTAVLDLRSRLMEFVRTVGINGVGNSLDIIADAPGGVQRIGNFTLAAVTNQFALDAEFASLIRERFAQCRLLGCVTALDLDARKRMLELASVLNMPVIGTLRAIAFPDFDDTSFVETQKIGDVEESIVISTEQMTNSGGHHNTEEEERIASGAIQREWLRRFHQVKFEPDDLEGEAPSDAQPWQMPNDLLNHLLASGVAATDKIHTAAAGIVALRTPSGAIRCEVLARATLLRLKSKGHGWVYVNIPPNSRSRGELLSRISA